MTEKRRYLTDAQKAEVRRRQHGVCGCGCGEALEGKTHFDHILPLWLGGTNEIDNFAELKERHHIEKSKRETKARAKIKRIIKKREGRVRAKKKIPNPGFQGWRDFQGRIRRRKENE